MSVGQFRSPNLHYSGWLEQVKESSDISILSPKDGEIFFTELGASKKEISVSGFLNSKRNGKILVIVRTDRDYPQALGLAKKDGGWEFSGITLGGVDHQIYAVLVDKQDKPIIRSNVVNVRLERT